MGNCNHRRYVPRLIDLVASGTMSLAPNVTRAATMTDIIDAYEAFDRREPGWLKVAVAAT
jgi:threonine dehydrogenase-like Zn-dependent dehydrogenase